MKKNKFLFISIAIFIFFNLIFNFQSWIELLSKKTPYNTPVGDSTLAEFILESNYQLINQGQNPFIFGKQLFYPFTINVSLNDPGSSNIIFFFLLRPFLGIHESMLLVVLINIFLANLLMYLLLKKLKINNWISTILSLSYGFMPIITYRVLGHYTYTSIYIFPLIYLIILKFFEERQLIKKLFLSILFGFFMMFILLLNFYYFLGIVIALFLYSIYFLIFNTKKIIKFYVKNFLYIISSILSFLFFISPWLYSVIKLIKSGGSEKVKTFGGAIELSGDFIGFFTPSEYNPFYYFIFSKLSNFNIIFQKYFKFYTNNTEKFNYPGLIILLTFFLVLVYKKKISQKLWLIIKPHFIISFIFASFVLGPFLKIAYRWIIVLDGVNVFIPLPFLLLHYLPGLSSLRAPTRFMPLFIFIALIATAYIINYLFVRIKKKQKTIFIVILFLVFIFDQFSILPKPYYQYFPVKIYDYLKNSKKQGVVFEIPFTVRDGFQYIGFVHAIGPMNGYLIHKKPIIGGYFARIDQKVFDFYKNKKFINYVAKNIDKGNYNPLKEKPKEPIIFDYLYSLDTIDKELKSLNIKYIILKNNEKYSEKIINLITKVGFTRTLIDEEYNLYEKN